MTREQRLEVALRHVERALREGDPAITDTLWMTRSESETCTMLDEVTMALAWPAALATESAPTEPTPRERDFQRGRRQAFMEAAVIAAPLGWESGEIRWKVYEAMQRLAAGVEKDHLGAPPSPGPSTGEGAAAICNAESDVGHHCQREPGHIDLHQDRHGNLWREAPGSSSGSGEGR